MIRFFQIGAAKLRPTIQALRRTGKPASAHKPRPPALLPAVRADTTPQPEPGPETTPPKPAMNTAETTLPRYFSPIKLGTAEPVDSGTIERQALVFGNTELQGLAIRCTAALDRLARAAAYTNFMSRAAEASHAHGGTPAEWLTNTLQAIEEEIDATKQEHGRHDARQKTRRNCLTPLELAVGQRLTSHERELQVLLENVRLAEQSPFGDQSKNVYQRLIDAGLKPEQIALVGIENPVSKIERDTELAKVRIAELQGELPALWAFSNDPLHSPEHLTGLGFEALIAASLNIVEESAA